MAPHSRPRAAQQAAAAAPAASIDDLPDGVLAQVLSFLPLHERLGPLSLVSKRFTAAARSPDLLREMAVGFTDVPALRSFTAWLASQGLHLQRLTLGLADGAAGGRGTAAIALSICLAVAGAAGQLVSLTARGALLGTEWLVAMPALRQLTLEMQPEGLPLQISPTISGLTALTSLALQGSPIRFLAGARLPATVERLTLEFDRSAALPYQVAQLPRLASLHLQECEYSAASLGVLSRLSGSLTSLTFFEARIPVGLSALTRLRTLLLWDGSMPPGSDASLAAALPRLSQLTRLMLLAQDPAVPAALAGLSNLQRCYLELDVPRNSALPPLPAGPWLASLRWLHYNAGGLVSSTAVLRAATALEYLDTIDTASVEWGSPAAAVVFDWLAQHTPLRHVVFDRMKDDPDHLGLFVAHATRLFSRRPDLLVEGTGLGPRADRAPAGDMYGEMQRE